MKALLRLFPLFCLVLFSACVNPYQQHYKPVGNGVAGVDYDPCPEPEIRQVGQVKDLQAEMYKKGYALIGFSAFNTADASAADLKKQATEVQACVAIVQKKYTHTESGYVPITEYHQGQQYQINTVGNASGNTNYYAGRYNKQVGTSQSNVEYMSNTTVTASDYTTTTYVPYQNRMHDFLASYWVKMKPPFFGVMESPIPDAAKLKLNIEKGFLIRAVREKSPAEEAGFIAGDIVVGYNGGQYVSDDDYSKYLLQNEGKAVEITIRRLDKELKKTVTLGTLPH